ncbi:Uncharacterized protein FKW44_010622 [Caligus rogercresseyi]|uniref:Uncharacterized protein n=1 Tax=Caligus rogercresseyi TaxID=217165 RepID=A0A7T8K958_CALRO|nr:Uncharacterized protein FKW44_010622 [Caligus rogercresseyi]
MSHTEAQRLLYEAQLKHGFNYMIFDSDVEALGSWCITTPGPYRNLTQRRGNGYHRTMGSMHPQPREMWQSMQMEWDALIYGRMPSCKYPSLSELIGPRPLVPSTPPQKPYIIPCPIPRIRSHF